MLNQYDTKWKNVKMGTTTSTIGAYGCNITSICQGLIDRGYDFTPETLNTRFTNNKSYSSGNLISPSTIASTNSDIFISGVNEAWDDNKIRAYLKDKSYFVVCEVSALGIGGTGQHFVLLRSLVESNGVIINSYIGDPWGGLENLTSVRYSKYGYIKSVRVYKVKIKEEESTTMTDDQKARDNGNKFFANIKGNINAKETPQDLAVWVQNDIDNVSNEINQAYKDKNSLATDISAKNLQISELQSDLAVKEDSVSRCVDEIQRMSKELEKKTADFEALQKSSLEEKQVLVATAKDTLDKQAKDYEKKITALELTITQLKTNINTIEVEKDYSLKELLIKIWEQIWKRI